MLPYMHALRHCPVNRPLITRANGSPLQASCFPITWRTDTRLTICSQIRTRGSFPSIPLPKKSESQPGQHEAELTAVDDVIADELLLAERLERAQSQEPRIKRRLQGPEQYWPTALLLEYMRKPETIKESLFEPKLRSILARGVQRNRLPAVMINFLLQKDKERLKDRHRSLSPLEDPVAWRNRLNYLRGTRGISSDDLQHWLWILQAEGPDLQVERLVSSNRRKPIFVLMAVLRTDNFVFNGESLVKLYEYIMRNYLCSPDLTSEAEYDDLLLDEGLSWGIEDRLHPSPHFLLLIDRLVHHCSLALPSSMPMIARLVVAFLETIPSDRRPNKYSKRTGYADRCLVFNHALHCFRRAPGSSRGSPLAHLADNWDAQKTLLAYSAGLERPLVIDRLSFTSIRIVLLGLKKSEAEKMAAIRYAKSWPPYIKPLDGTDESRDPTDYFSRSVKAGLLKRSEGYADDESDNALDVIGGAKPGESVTIHTRSSDLGLWPKQWSSLRVFTEWAARVKATRGIYEAWRMFHSPPLPGLKPNFTVYYEMFAKLFAKQASNPSILPGEAKETYPPHIANLTEYELARTKPCSPDELYERMLRDGNRPVHQCLALLVRNAPSLERAAQFLHDSPIPTRAIEDLTTSPLPRYANLKHIPIAVFDDYIALMCSLQGRRRWPPWSRNATQPGLYEQYRRLDRAINLVNIRLGGSRKPGAHPWHIVMRALARKRLVFVPTASQIFDDIGALSRIISLFKIYGRVQGICVVAFDCLARCVLKVRRHEIPGTVHHGKAEKLETEAAGMLKDAFTELTRPVQTSTTHASSPLLGQIPSVYHEISSAHVQTYLELLAKQGDVDEALRVMDWVLSAWDLGPDVLKQARHPQHKQFRMMRQAIACFRGFVEDMKVPSEVVEKIEKRFVELEEKGGTWTWPDDEEMKEYQRYAEFKNAAT